MDIGNKDVLHLLFIHAFQFWNFGTSRGLVYTTGKVKLITDWRGGGGQCENFRRKSHGPPPPFFNQEVYAGYKPKTP